MPFELAAGHIQQLLGGIDACHAVAGRGEAEELRPLATTNVEYPEGRIRTGKMFRQLASDKLLANGVANEPELALPLFDSS